GERCANPDPAPGPGAGSHPPPVRADPLPHPDEPVARPRLAIGRRPRAVVGDLELELVLAIPHGDPGPNGPRVLDRVRERLLDDPVGRQVDALGEFPRLALPLPLHLEPSPPGLLEQPVE